jgi:hypothetical protein
MPTYPATKDATAPTRNPRAVLGPSATTITAKMMMPVIPMLLSWRLRYAIAPSLIALAISRIFSFPAGAVFTLAARIMANTTPAIPTNVHINGRLFIAASLLSFLQVRLANAA